MYQCGMNFPTPPTGPSHPIDPMTPLWAWTIVLSERLPADMTTGMSDRDRAISYEIIWALERIPPSSGYLEPLDHPASTTPYTASDPIASTHRRPTLRSAISKVARWPKSSTDVPKGIEAKARKAASIEMPGARAKVTWSAVIGVMGSLNMSFSPSATLVRRPNGPQRLGPSRLCMWATTLRSNQTMNTTSTLSTRNTMRILARMTTRSARKVMLMGPP